MSSELQLDVCCLVSCCGGDIWWTRQRKGKHCIVCR